MNHEKRTRAHISGKYSDYLLYGRGHENDTKMTRKCDSAVWQKPIWFSTYCNVPGTVPYHTKKLQNKKKECSIYFVI